MTDPNESSNDKLDDALDALDGESGTVSIDQDGGTAEVDVVEADRLGVRVRGVRVTRKRGVDVAREAKELPDRLRSLPDRVEPSEVAPELGGSRLRSKPRKGEYFEVDVAPDRTDIRRTRVDDEGERHETDWTMTRDQLGRIIDEARGDETDEAQDADQADNS